MALTKTILKKKKETVEDENEAPTLLTYTTKDNETIPLSKRIYNEVVANRATIINDTREMIKQADINHFKLGFMLKIILQDQLFNSIPEYSELDNTQAFQAFCEDYLKFSVSKAYQLIRLYTKLVNVFGAEKAEDIIIEVGVSKLYTMEAILNSENAEQLLSDSRNKSVRELQDHIRDNYTDEGSKIDTRLQKTKFSYKAFEEEANEIKNVLAQYARENNISEEEATVQIILEYGRMNYGSSLSETMEEDSDVVIDTQAEKWD
jgi:hypothetical protein